METTSGIAILDIGKTNKKLIVMDQDYRIVLEESESIPETFDEDGFPCEDITLLNNWFDQSVGRLRELSNLSIKAMNFSAYGASLVHGPLYNYLKPYLHEWRQHFELRNGSIADVSLETSSPDLGSLNSGMQLFRLASFNPKYRDTINYALHLPQYVCWYFSGRTVSEISSIGCHTMLWNFAKHDYHYWVKAENLTQFLAPLHPAGRPVTSRNERHGMLFGTGLHDSSAALVPYLRMSGEKFLVISTGTWSISLNPFNKEILTADELSSDCLSYITPYGDQVKSSRFFSGPIHDQLITRIKEYFHYFPELNNLRFNKEWFHPEKQPGDLSSYATAEEAYQNLMWGFVKQQKKSTDLVLGDSNVQRVCVDGGFSKNFIFMQLLAQAYPDLDIYAAVVPQASAIGAAMVLEGVWNPDPPAIGVVELRYVPHLRGF